jgi:hypothetical protein
MKNLEVKIFVTAVTLLELLDETDGDTKFKNKLRYHLNGVEKEINKIVSVSLDHNDTSLLISNASQALEDSIDKVLEG